MMGLTLSHKVVPDLIQSLPFLFHSISLRAHSFIEITLPPTQITRPDKLSPLLCNYKLLTFIHTQMHTLIV